MVEALSEFRSQHQRQCGGSQKRIRNHLAEEGVTFLECGGVQLQPNSQVPWQETGEMEKVVAPL